MTSGPWFRVGVEPFIADGAGYENLAGWPASFGPVTRIGVEGTGSHRVGLARFITSAGIEVVDAYQPNPSDTPREGQVRSDQCISPGSSVPIRASNSSISSQARGDARSTVQTYPNGALALSGRCEVL